MKYSLIIQRAAITARLLGYVVKREVGRGATENGFKWYAYVKSPDGLTCLTLNNPMWEGDSVAKAIEPTEGELLGHWKVRLHMESRFGIETSHYWEGGE